MHAPKAAAALFLGLFCLLVVINLDENHTEASIKIAVKEDTLLSGVMREGNDAQKAFDAALIKPAQIKIPALIKNRIPDLSEGLSTASKNVGDIRDQTVTKDGRLHSGNGGRRRTGDGFGLNGGPRLKKDNYVKLTPCVISKTEKGHKVLKDAFDPNNAEAADCITEETEDASDSSSVKSKETKPKDSSKLAAKEKPGAVDTYTKALTGAKCDWDKTKTECAVCQKGGCQCPKAHKDQCVKCGKDTTQCGSAEFTTAKTHAGYDFTASFYYQWCTLHVPRYRDAKIKEHFKEQDRNMASDCPQPHQKCPTTCGHPGSIIEGKIFCETIRGKKKVDKKFCSFPDHPGNRERCPATPSCFKWGTTPAATCPTSCGKPASTLRGGVKCVRKSNGSIVGNGSCSSYLGKSIAAPQAPQRHCPATAICTVYVQGKPPGCPGKSCGAPANTEVGQVYCAEVNTGARTSDAACSHWGHSKPKKLTRYCAGGSRCCGQKGKCANDCCTFVARWAAPTNSCANCPFGNHHVYPRECGSSRRCDATRL